MEACYPTPSRRETLHRPFVVSPYRDDGAGRLAPALPNRCPKAVAQGGKGVACAVELSHWRPRKTGPKVPVMVCRCRPHRRGFTVYPPAFAPYQRQPVLRLGLGGEPLLDGSSGAGVPAPRSSTACPPEFEDTPFEAAFAGEGGVAWPRDSEEEVPDHWWSTQVRKIRWAARVLGLAKDIVDDLRAKLAAVLGVDTLRLKDLAARLPGYRSAARAVVQVLRGLRRVKRRGFDLLECAHLVGCWGEPLRFERDRGFERAAFR